MNRLRFTLSLLMALVLFLGFGFAAGTGGTARGQGKAAPAADLETIELRSFQTDFRTLYECLERVARDRNLGLERTGGGWGLGAVRMKERFALVVDKEKLSFSETPYMHIADI
jgi:hypothetical protein